MKILIIEDEKDLRNNMMLYLSSQEYHCEIAKNYNEAIDKIATFHYDCILLDLMLPDGNGLQILEFIKKENKEDGVIIISAKDSLDDKIKGLELVADDYLAKPFHLQELSARIFSLIRRKQFQNSNNIQ